MQENQVLKPADSNFELKSYATNFGFANWAEFQQFSWFREVLDPNRYVLCHNFFIYDPQESVFREIDFGILSRNLFIIIEHKQNLGKAKAALINSESMYIRVKKFFEDQGVTDYPKITSKVVLRDKGYPYNIEVRPVGINSPSDSKLFIKDVVRKEKPYKTVSETDINNILDVLKCKPYEYKQINHSIFKIFEKWPEIFENQNDLENKRNFLPMKDIHQLVCGIYNNFNPINYLLSDIFIDLENERKTINENDEKKECDQIFCFHTMSPKDIISNRYRIYWVCITPSQDKYYSKEFQLGFHISDMEWYVKGQIEKCERKHFTIKLAFFRSIEKWPSQERNNSLKTFQEKLENEKAKFKDLLLKLNEDGGETQFQFYRTKTDRFDVESSPIDGNNCDIFINNIIAYDNGETAIPRSTEIVKIFDWNDDNNRNMRKAFDKKKNAIAFLKREYSKLINLYKFMIDIDD